MATSDNGWSVIYPEDARSKTTFVKIGKATFQVRKGTEELWRLFLTELNKIEPFSEAGWDGAYAFRLVLGSETNWSCHASATAIDMNASQHPRGRGLRYKGWSLKQRYQLRKLLNSTLGKAFKWGNDFSTTPDGMHFQLREPAVVNKIMGQLGLRVVSRAEQVRAQTRALQRDVGIVADGVWGPKTDRELSRFLNAFLKGGGSGHRTRVRRWRKILGLKTGVVARWDKLADDGFVTLRAYAKKLAK